MSVASVVRFAVAIAWGVALATPLVARARRIRVASRLTAASGSVAGRAADEPASPPRADRRRGQVPVAIGAFGPIVRVFRALVARRRDLEAAGELQRELPVALDLLGVAVGAGCTPFQAVEVAARWAAPAVAAPLGAVIRACGLGAGFDAALTQAARDQPLLGPLADALLASDRLGAPVAPALGRLAAEERAALRRRAEAHARRVPVRLLFPLVFLVLPAFVLLTLVPGLASGLSRL